MARPPKVLPVSASRVAQEAGGAILEEYEVSGLTCYRTVKEIGSSGNYIVEEGWIEKNVLPNGKVIYIKRKHKDVSLDHAKHNR